MWERKRKRYSKPDQEYYSVSNKLKSDGKITGDFEVMLSSLTMEEIIALRLELAARSIGGKLYGLKLWESLPRITKAAALKYSYSAARTKNEAAAFLGISKNEFRKLLKQYKITNFFEKNT